MPANTEEEMIDRAQDRLIALNERNVRLAREALLACLDALSRLEFPLGFQARGYEAEDVIAMLVDMLPVLGTTRDGVEQARLLAGGL